MRLLDLPEDVLAMLERGELTEAMQTVLAVPDHEDRRRLARLSARAVGTRRSRAAARWAAAGADPGELLARPPIQSLPIVHGRLGSA